MKQIIPFMLVLFLALFSFGNAEAGQFAHDESCFAQDLDIGDFQAPIYKAVYSESPSESAWAVVTLQKNGIPTCSIAQEAQGIKPAFRRARDGLSKN